nr:transcription factor VOZ1-like [Ipomoea batatas]
MWNYISALTHDLLHPQVHQELTTENLGDGSGDAASKVYVFKIVKGPIMFCHVKNIGESPILEFVENYTLGFDQTLCYGYSDFQFAYWLRIEGFQMGKSSRSIAGRSATYQIFKDRAKNRVDDLQGMFTDLQSLRKESRTIEVAVLEEQLNQMLREWKAELNEPSPASSLQV